MNAPDHGPTLEADEHPPGREGFLRASCAVLVIAVCVAYANSFSGVFVLDDHPAILTNSTIRSVSWAAWHPPVGQGLTVEGRPVLNFTLALNYAISGTDAWGYHAVNLAIHSLATVTLLALLRRLLARVALPHARDVAFFVALLWGLHPLQTESVTYVVQRTESLMGLLYLGTLYCSVRGMSGDARAKRWFAAAVAVCALGMATKEVMVSAPLLALLVDRTLFAGSFAAAWRERRGFYGALCATWLVLLFLQLGQLDRGGTIGAAAGVTWWQYACTQARALVHYIRLSAWPFPLVFDYGSDFVHFRQIWLHGLVDLGLLAATFVALWRRSAFGLVGAWFFFILAPTSSFVGGSRQMLAEHRMYLSLAAVVVLLVLGVYRAAGARFARWALGLAAVGLLGLTIDRNADYRSDLALYEDNYRKRPNEAHSMHNYGNALHNRGRTEEAIALYESALRLKPEHAAALEDLSRILAPQSQREPQLLRFYDEFLRRKPRDHRALNNAAVLLLRLPGRESEAIARLEAALKIEPDYPEAHFNMAEALVRLPERRTSALAHYAAAARLKPDYAEAQLGLGVYLTMVTARHDAALEPLRAAVRLKPDWPEAHFHLAFALSAIAGGSDDALLHYEAAVRLQPDYPEARNGLAMLLAGMPGRQADAIAHLEAAVNAKPDYAEAHNNLGLLLAQVAGRPADALRHFEAAVAANPNFADAHFGLGMTLQMLGRPRDAARHFAAALKIRPNFSEARAQLERVQQ
jgi:protein O-mannosyl-transferase